MNRPLPTNIQHFNRLLTEYEKQESGMTARRARHAIGVVVICAMVDRVRDNDGAHLFVAKGGSAMQIRLGMTARTTTDLDFLFRGGAHTWLDHFDTALREGPWKGFDGQRKGEPEGIQVPGMHYQPQRFDVRLQYKGKAFSTIQIELALDGIGAADMVDGIDLGFFGLDAPPIPCMSVPLQMAQKLHACSDPYEGADRENDRTRDLVDLWLLEALLPPDSLADVRTAAVETFARRAKHQWPPVLTITEIWRADYPKLAAEVVGALSTVEQAADYVADLIRRIDVAT